MLTVSPPAQKRSFLSGIMLLRLVFLSLISLSVTRLAWLSDDALITLRSVLNMSHGWGAGFNSTEVVQAYTHPLWMLIWLSLGSIFSNWIFLILFTSIVLSTIAVAIILFSCRSKSQVLIVGVALLSSSAFLDYATSGLENPLAYLLVVLAVWISLKPHLTISWITLLALVFSSLVLTRFDFALLVLPVALYLLLSWRKEPKKYLLALFVTALPLILWFWWSYVTYASVLPNTFAAKSNLDIPRIELLIQGLQYFSLLLRTDLVTSTVLVIGSVFVAFFGTALQRSWIVGILIYLSYVVYVGGDFMAGRFVAVPFIAVLMLSICVPQDRYPRVLTQNPSKLILASAAIAILGISFLSGPNHPSVMHVSSEERFERASGIVDERSVYMGMNRTLFDLLNSDFVKSDSFNFPLEAIQQPDVHITTLNEAAASWPRKSGNESDYPIAVGDTCGIGATAVMAGPRIHWVDSCALADRFLASVRFSAPDWRIGHFVRAVPEGYLDAIQRNDPTLLMDESESLRLQELWSKIK